MYQKIVLLSSLMFCCLYSMENQLKSWVREATNVQIIFASNGDIIQIPIEQNSTIQEIKNTLAKEQEVPYERLQLEVVVYSWYGSSRYSVSDNAQVKAIMNESNTKTLYLIIANT